MDDYYAARSRIIPPLPWPTFAPPFSSVAVRHIDDDSFLERLIFANHGSLGRSIEATMKALGRALRRPERCLTLQDFRRGLQFETGVADPGPYDEEPRPALRAALEQRGWTP